MEGWRLSSSVTYVEPIPKHITDRQITMRHKLLADNETHSNHIPLLSHMLPRDQAKTRPSSRASASASNSGSNSPHIPSYTSRWVEDMAKVGRSASQSSTRTTPEDRGRRRGRRFANPDPTFSRPGNRSASPRPSVHRSIGEKEVLRESLVRKLRHKGLPLVQKRPMWSLSKDMTWNPLLLQHGILMYWDLESQVRMRYWSLCATGISTISEILGRAILHSVRFAIGIQARDIEIFRPEKLSETDRLLSSRTYEPGFIEMTLEAGLGPAFADRYFGKLADILRRPHARALIGRGGPASWIARMYGDSLVQKFMTGPSLQVTFHEKGLFDSKDRRPVFARCDDLTPGELDLVYGHIRSGGGDHNKWVFPTPELLDELCNHWSGEWNDQLEFVFQEIQKELMGPNTRARSRGDWRTFFHQSNRGEHAPERRLTIHDFSDWRNDMVEGGFTDDWNKKNIREIEYPEYFRPPAGGN